MNSDFSCRIYLGPTPSEFFSLANHIIVFGRESKRRFSECQILFFTPRVSRVPPRMRKH
jgi:hypothetical protein